jgi:hypothetical protein
MRTFENNVRKKPRTKSRVSRQSSEKQEGESTADPREYVRAGPPPPKHPQLVCLEPEFPEHLWDESCTQTDLLAKCIIGYQYHDPGPMPSQERRDFLNQVESLLQKGADPNLTLCVYKRRHSAMYGLLGHEISPAGLMLGFSGDKNTVVVPSEGFQLSSLFTPFLESIAQDDIEMIVLFLRYGVNARDLTREFEISSRDIFSALSVPHSASRSFQSIRYFVKNVDILHVTSLQTRVVDDISKTLCFMDQCLDISYNGKCLISRQLVKKMNNALGNNILGGRSVTVSDVVWSYSHEPLTAGCVHLQKRERWTMSATPLSAVCSMCRLVECHRQDVAAYLMPHPKISLSLHHISETQRWELASRFDDIERRHAVRPIPCM